jgi:hypothetical protein
MCITFVAVMIKFVLMSKLIISTHFCKFNLVYPKRVFEMINPRNYGQIHAPQFYGSNCVSDTLTNINYNALRGAVNGTIVLIRRRAMTA